ncbi:MAG: 3'-5' exonuclease domain-containing protein 2 [Opitutales bacterium]|nr:3'-5' exonuclease domain-containing protein 2 [Opitutales bacterium]
MEIPSAESLDIDTTITKDSLNDLPLFRFDGPVVIVSSDDEVPAAVKALRKETLLGFDTETRPSFRKGQNYPPALLQLAGSSTVYLFQLLRLKQLDPVLELLASPSICKVGVAIRDDIRKLREHHTFAPSGFLELSDSTQKAGVVNTGLRSLAGILLGIRISKGAQVSNWSRKELSESQVRYAATDAWISRMIHEKLVDLGLLLKDDSAA